MATCVVLDSNQFYHSNLLRSAVGQALWGALASIDGRIGLPEVVRDEVTERLAETLNEAASRMVTDARRLKEFARTQTVPSRPTDEEIRQALEDRWTEIERLCIGVPLTLEHARSAMRRAVKREPPASKNKEEYRDCLIWEAVRHLASAYEVHLVTGDAGFYQGGSQERAQLAPGLRGECPSVRAHTTLESCIEALQDVRPPRIDLRAVLDKALPEVMPELHRTADPLQFAVLGPPPDWTPWNGSLLATSDPHRWALAFDLTLPLLDLEPGARRQPATITAAGQGFCDPHRQHLSDIRLDFVRVVWTDEDGHTHRRNVVLGYSI